jgi:alcohol dehydrogenase class IV
MVFAPGALDQLGPIAKAEGATRVMLVTDPGIRAAGHAERAVRSLYRASLVVGVFDGVEENPTTV